MIATCRSHAVSAVGLTLLTAFLSGLSPNQAVALGSRIPNQDARAIGRGNAFVATADNPAAIYYNPAGISQLDGHNLQIGSLFYLGIDADYKSPAGQGVGNEQEVLPVPQLHYVYAPSEQPFAVGLGVYSPFGLGMEWPDNAPFRSAGLKAEVLYATVNPVVAWKPHRSFAMAIGPTFNYTEAELVTGQPAPGFRFGFKGHEWLYGFNAGVLWQPHRKWSFGLKYFSATEASYSGTVSFKPAADFLPPPTITKTHLDFPQMLAGGVSFRPDTNWNIEVNVDWTDWDVVESARIEHFGALTLNWKSSFFYHVGATRTLGKGYYVSLGYFFSEASTPDKDYTPLVPDVDLHVGSLGFGRMGQRWSWALAGQLIGGDYREIDEARDASVNGSYRLFTPTVSFSVGYKF